MGYLQSFMLVNLLFLVISTLRSTYTEESHQQIYALVMKMSSGSPSYLLGEAFPP